jgi:hypothetical protein
LAARVAWGAFAAWALLIFATVPFARALEALVVARLGERAFLVAVLAIVAASALLAWRPLTGLGARARAALAAGAALYAGAAWWLRANPVEAVHVVEYGARSACSRCAPSRTARATPGSRRAPRCSRSRWGSSTRRCSGSRRRASGICATSA